ncbi:hypothetical protein L9F63_017557, partial [Diploptera punctata]
GERNGSISPYLEEEDYDVIKYYNGRLLLLNSKLCREIRSYSIVHEISKVLV